METKDDALSVTSADLQRPSKPAFELVATIVKLLEPLTPEEQRHILQTVVTWLHLADCPSHGQQQQPATIVAPSDQPPGRIEEYPFSGRKEITPKEFLLEKDPKTDGERLACLAYYLTHYRDQPYFKT